MLSDEQWMQKAIAEAYQADYQTWQNPRVGAVVVKNNQLLAVGHTHEFGGVHAERDAISKLSPEQTDGATLYVTLEPCNHFGKQPPCSQLIINSKIRKVVIAEKDPHSLVTGKGIRTLKSHGIKVMTGILTKEAEEINPHYNFFFRHQRPWITLKQAVSLDYKVSAVRGQRTQITNQEVYDYVHQERVWYHGILIGSQTAIIDNPRLTVTVPTHFPPVRIIIDRRGRLANHLDLLLLQDQTTPTWIFTNNKLLKERLAQTVAEVIWLADCSVEAVIQECANRGLQSLYVEGGPTIHKSFLAAGVVNELVTYLAPRLIGKNGVAGFQVDKPFVGETINFKQLGDNLRISERMKENV